MTQPMAFVLGASFTSIAIDVALAFTAFFVGSFASFFYCRFVANRSAGSPEGAPVEVVNDSLANDAARATMAAQQLRDLAHNVKTDVGAHNTFVESINDQLGALKQDDAGNNAIVMDAVAKMLEANKKLAERLEDAEQKIQVQAEEIRTQQSEARTDSLTKLANRRAFDAALEESIGLFRKKEQPFSLLIMDVDHFKNFNDTHGHPAGDEVLRCVGRTLMKIVKTGDLACRYGGEEFAVVMPHTRAAEAQIAAERIRKGIESMVVQFGGKTLHVTASIGMAECHAGEDGAKLVRRADDCVYASKKSGRNCSHWHDGAEILRIAGAKKVVAEAPPAARSAPRAGGLPTAAQLPDRVAFTDELRRRVAESQRFGVPLSVLHFRLQDFYKLENRFGTGIGALLLDSLATFISSTLRDMDLLGKLDAGEFIVMLPGSSISAAKIVGQRVKTSISLCPIPLGDQQIRLQLDMGVAAVHTGEDATNVMAAAKASMEASAGEVSDDRAQPELAAV